jgi:hypothetical protein
MNLRPLTVGFLPHVVCVLLVVTGCRPPTTRNAERLQHPTSVMRETTRPPPPAAEVVVVKPSTLPARAESAACAQLRVEQDLLAASWPESWDERDKARSRASCWAGEHDAWATSLVVEKGANGHLAISTMLLYADASGHVERAGVAILGVDPVVERAVDLDGDGVSELIVDRMAWERNRGWSWIEILTLHKGAAPAIGFHALTAGDPIVAVADVDDDGQLDLISKADVRVCRERTLFGTVNGRRAIVGVTDDCTGTDAPLVCRFGNGVGAFTTRDCPAFSLPLSEGRPRSWRPVPPRLARPQGV